VIEMTKYRSGDEEATESIIESYFAGNVNFDKDISWLRHSGGAGAVDFALIKGASMLELSQYRGAVGRHLRHLKKDHGVEIIRVDGKYRIANSGSVSNAFEDISEITNSTIPETEKQTLVRARLGQGRFRSDLFKLWNGRCCVSGCQLSTVLRASHIKPWSECTNEERLDPYNGLLLIPQYDTAFDLGYISFDENGKMVISEYLSLEDRVALGIRDDVKIILHEKNKKYMQYHLTERFRGSSSY
jgi:predicted restriction endonuclease